MKVLLVCERSGGHIFPALAFAKKLLSSSSKNEVTFFVTSSFLKDCIKKEGYPVRGKSFPFRSLIIESVWRLFEALYIIMRLRPQKIIGFGGRDSIFLVLFGSFLFRDTAIYEPNIKFGRANKFLSFFAQEVLSGFPLRSKNKKIKSIGIPLRKNIRRIDKAKAREILNFDNKPVILCFGGSQGSAFINDIFLKSVQQFGESLQIIHLTGKDNYLGILKLYNKIKSSKFIKDFFYEMEILYSACDLVISRAGAVTLGELAYYRLPSILIPHPKAATHQKENALYFKKQGVAFVHLQNDFSFDNFDNCLQRLIYDSKLCQNMINNFSKIKLGVSFEDFCHNSSF